MSKPSRISFRIRTLVPHSLSQHAVQQVLFSAEFGIQAKLPDDTPLQY